MPRYCAIFTYYRMCSTDVYCSLKPAAVAPKTITHHFFVSGIGQKKTVDAAKFVAAQKMLKPKPANIRKWIARFYYFGIYTPLEACVLLTIIAWVAHRYGQLYLHCSLIYFWVPSDLFCIVISLSEGEILRYSAVSASRGRLHYPRQAREQLHALTDRLLWCATDDDPAATSSRRASFSALASANSLRVFCIERGNITLLSAYRDCRVRQLRSLAFLSRWAL